MATNDSSSIPKFDLQIGSVPVPVIPRAIKMEWTQEAVDDLRALWRPPWPRRPDNALDLLNDALEDPNYDPSSTEPYEGLWRNKDGTVATPKEVMRAHQPVSSLVEDMADEIRAEIDREILSIRA